MEKSWGGGRGEKWENVGEKNLNGNSIEIISTGLRNKVDQTSLSYDVSFLFENCKNSCKLLAIAV